MQSFSGSHLVLGIIVFGVIIIHSFGESTTYSLCENNYYCLGDAPLTAYSTVQACSDACFDALANYHYFNVDSYTQTCYCAVSCDYVQSNPDTSFYAMNNAACTVVPTEAPTLDPTEAPSEMDPSSDSPTLEPTSAPSDLDFFPTPLPTTHHNVTELAHGSADSSSKQLEMYKAIVIALVVVIFVVFCGVAFRYCWLRSDGNGGRSTLGTVHEERPVLSEAV
jgi:hypothetical protein